MLDFDSLELEGIEDVEQAILESVVGFGEFLFDPLFDEEVELLASLDS